MVVTTSDTVKGGRVNTVRPRESLRHLVHALMHPLYLDFTAHVPANGRCYDRSHRHAIHSSGPQRRGGDA
jgi:hypothetical protein